jgi:hypothetical protein
VNAPATGDVDGADDVSYQVDSKFHLTGQVSDIELSTSSNGLTRKVLRAEIVENPKESTNSVRASLVHQKRKHVEDLWEDVAGTDLKQTQVNRPSKFTLDSAETRVAFEHLVNLYEIGKGGVNPGKEVIRMTDPGEWLRVGRQRADLIRQLIVSGHEQEVWDILAELKPDLTRSLSVALLHKKRSAAVAEFEEALTETRDENFWKKLLRANEWMFGGANVRIVQESRLDIQNIADIPFEVAGGFMDIVELKRPDLPFWAQSSTGGDFHYRNKFLLPHHELQGAISQTFNYILQAEKQVANTDFIRAHGVVPLKPRGLVVHGRSSTWTQEQWDAFRVLNDGLHGVQVMTFDHLLEQARRSLHVEP